MGVREDGVFRVGESLVDFGTGLARRGGTIIQLDARELALLKVLVENAGKLVTYECFRERVWDDAYVEIQASVQTRVSSLRSKLGITIKNERGSGYSLQTPVHAEPDEGFVPPPRKHQEEPPQRPFRSRRYAIVGVVLALIGTGSGGFYWFNHRKRLPDRFTIEGKLLTVLDDHNEVLWMYSSFPQEITSTKVSSDNWPHKFLDTRGQRLLILQTDTLLYCFDSHGKNLWVRPPGRETMTKNGVVPANYAIRLLASLSRPRQDGGWIIVGSSRGVGALFMVELLTAEEGKRVAEYFHFGWFFDIKVWDLGHGEHIFLSGVDSAGGDYGATLVVLAPDDAWGQSMTEAADPRGELLGEPTAHERAVLLIKELPFLSKTNFCRGTSIEVAGRYLEIYVNQGGAPGAYFRFGSRLELQNVLPDVIYQSRLNTAILKNVSKNNWQDVLKRTLGDVKYIHNEYQY